MAQEAGTKALEDAGIPYDEIEQAAVGYCYGDSTCGERAVYELGLTGIPIYNVNNNCSTGSTALFMAKQFVEGGLADCVWRSASRRWRRARSASSTPTAPSRWTSTSRRWSRCAASRRRPPAPQIFGNAGREHMEKYGTTPEHFAKIGWKNHKHSVNNPYSQFQDEYTLEDILNAPMIYEPLTKLQCCPDLGRRRRGDPRQRGLRARSTGSQDQAVEIVGMAMTTDFREQLRTRAASSSIGSDMTRKPRPRRSTSSPASGPRTSTWSSCTTASRANELITYEALGLCARGQGRRVHRLGRATPTAARSW